ncbi:MAG: hypothetical protein A4S09_03930 [Proteobacteria bacterium SG_bin7]|nr:MAG: hypothetical protein A4S09_03930 [Proteobacteria bacterium SG_bin7]
MKFTKIFLAITMSLSATAALADTISVGHPQYGGSGCPVGSVSAVLSPGQEALSVIFDQYIAEAGISSNKTLDRKSCNVAIPVHIPQGLSVGIFKVDYRGFANVPAGALGQFNVEYFFAGARGPSVRTPFRNTQQDYLITHNLQTQAIVWTPCGADTNLRINSSILAQTNRYGEDTMMTVDTVDVTSGLLFHLQWRSCR